ncbi:di-heme oxidoredictase family protein [Sulfurimonas marina]|uniref:C-type cytochrome n=1 Tax=Sulfurimonas marina TaxID=2590551 RepID=A0A7M1AXJ2_9BACT|nr:di-heme oxidoredictase family protein [Sulfurimonas marina]QOP42181.1 c-type cytochrome [Sulfurimonas marina]
MPRVTTTLTLTGFLFAACSSDRATQDTTAIYTQDKSKHVFTKAVKLSHEDEDYRILGKSFFKIPWVEAPSATTARDGLGPLFSANTCIHCHPHNGAGIALDKDGNIHRSLVMRLSIPSEKKLNNDLMLRNGFIPEPTYGGQLSFNGVSDVKYEGSVALSYVERKGAFEDGETYTLHEPHYELKNLQYGAIQQDANVAPHIALALIGLGAIEDIAVEEILKNEDIDDKDKDGISGKANWVYNPETNTTALGRFTWKAASATVKHQSANAAHNDMGLSNPLYPSDNCTDKQEECLKAPKGRGGFDLPMERLDAITYYLKTLKIPAQRRIGGFEKGQELFDELGCVKCHVDSFTTEKGVEIHPYSDFLLHDMGERLGDGHTIFKAEANEFRTPPLWGIGLYEKVSGELNLLHDGRAKSISEAILWHGGEAQAQKEAFRQLDKKQRETLLEFLKGI